MYLTMKGQYATRAMLDLSRHYAAGPQTTEAIARRQHIPAKYLEQVLRSLRAAHLLRSRRGAHGGHELAKPPAEISLGDVIRGIGAPDGLVPCVGPGPEACTCPDVSTCALRPSWLAVRDAISVILDQTSLALLVERSQQLEERQADSVMYYI